MSELVVGSIAGLAANSYVVDVASGSTLDLSAGAVFPAGNVINVSSYYLSGNFATTSTTYVDVTDLSVTVTPKSSGSKFLAIVSAFVYNATATDLTRINLVRDSTELISCQAESAITFQDVPIVINYLDSPATTSSVTYKVQMESPGGGAGTIRRAHITVLEIAG